jgi:hypothetical protein
MFSLFMANWAVFCSCLVLIHGKLSLFDANQDIIAKVIANEGQLIAN